MSKKTKMFAIESGITIPAAGSRTPRRPFTPAVAAPRKSTWLDRVLPAPIKRVLGLTETHPASTNGKRGPKPLYPFHQMRVGDSFFVPRTRQEHPSQLQKRIGVSTAVAKRKGIGDFTTRRIGDEGVRVWRIQ